MISAVFKKIMAKQVAEHSNRLSIFWLKKHGYLHKDYSYNAGNIKWTYGESDEGSNISFSVSRDDWGKPEEKTYIKLIYTYTDNWSGEKESMNYEIKLASTLCNFGGKRYWFICPLVKNGNYCGRRVGVLYNFGKWFGCRHCGNIAYNSQMQSERYKGFVSIPDIERAEKEVKRCYYKGKPTKKYERVLRLNEKFEYSLFKSYSRLVKLNKL